MNGYLSIHQPEKKGNKEKEKRFLPKARDDSKESVPSGAALLQPENRNKPPVQYPIWHETLVFENRKFLHKKPLLHGCINLNPEVPTDPNEMGSSISVREKAVMGKATIQILALDDNSVATHLDHAGYRKMGVKVYLASSWREAERLLRDLHGELQLSMVNLESPIFDAMSLIRNLHAFHPELPIVATGIHVSSAGIEAALREGASIYIEQPIPRGVFLERILALLKQRHRSTERVEVEPPGFVRLTFEGNHMQMPITNLSTSGFFATIQGPQPWSLQEGQTPVHLELCLPGRLPLLAEGTVIRVASAQQGAAGGVGVRFSALSLETKLILHVFIRENGWEGKEKEYYL
jgi:CheY-like chemotaxis protein